MNFIFFLVGFIVTMVSFYVSSEFIMQGSKELASKEAQKAIASSKKKKSVVDFHALEKAHPLQPLRLDVRNYDGEEIIVLTKLDNKEESTVKKLYNSIVKSQNGLFGKNTSNAKKSLALFFGTLTPAAIGLFALEILGVGYTALNIGLVAALPVAVLSVPFLVRFRNRRKLKKAMNILDAKPDQKEIESGKRKAVYWPYAKSKSKDKNNLYENLHTLVYEKQDLHSITALNALLELSSNTRASKEKIAEAEELINKTLAERIKLLEEGKLYGNDLMLEYNNSLVDGIVGELQALDEIPGIR